MFHGRLRPATADLRTPVSLVCTGGLGDPRLRRRDPASPAATSSASYSPTARRALVRPGCAAATPPRRAPSGGATRTSGRRVHCGSRASNDPCHDRTGPRELRRSASRAAWMCLRGRRWTFWRRESCADAALPRVGGSLRLAELMLRGRHEPARGWITVAGRGPRFVRRPRRLRVRRAMSTAAGRSRPRPTGDAAR